MQFVKLSSSANLGLKETSRTDLRLGLVIRSWGDARRPVRKIGLSRMAQHREQRRCSAVRRKLIVWAIGFAAELGDCMAGLTAAFRNRRIADDRVKWARTGC